MKALSDILAQLNDWVDCLSVPQAAQNRNTIELKKAQLRGRTRYSALQKNIIISASSICSNLVGICNTPCARPLYKKEIDGKHTTQFFWRLLSTALGQEIPMLTSV
ncbi:uncharacterized protein PHALS_11994 [Plasmopara halstedii]|uniref:Uncharacterized protein n=1 Tax=Plasmopara halstedii TaxID=4781 RepID=A0A0P1ALS9_PLAHL|nr:uncharacterized protein PHALS_11994 [Plasmopara halstedii]CEG41663.1 hypothetical protein PHALS_11994 [Plasmopara halstedii]|eukprot:XP_024578032.1 hypothetical protein PHALS_11994 [Plasmopara halstedii]